MSHSPSSQRTDPAQTSGAPSPVCAYGTCSADERCGGCCTCLGGCLRADQFTADCVSAAREHAAGKPQRLDTDKDTPC